MRSIIMNQDVAGDFAVGDATYLNNASVSIMPHESIEAMREFLLEYNRMGPDSAGSDALVREMLGGARRAVAEAIGARPEEIVFTQSTTDGINIVANGLDLSAGSNIIIRGGPHEHHANYYPWLRLGERMTVKELQVDDDGFFDLGRLASSIDADTRLVALSHALYNTGAILPLGRVGEIIRRRVPFFVDGAQTVGCMRVSVSEIDCDFMAFNGSKWLCGPMGTGIFYCKGGSAGLLEPTSVGGESATADGGQISYKEMPDRFQAGFRNYAGMAGLESSARYLLKFGLDNVRARNSRLAGALREELARVDGITLYGPEDPDMRTSIVSFGVDGIKPDMVVAKLEKDGIILAVREMVGKKMVRASPHLFNTDEEMARVAGAIKRL